ncbi:hypothetical protein GCM10027343_19240 [Noviherbaspirillum agri]
MSCIRDPFRELFVVGVKAAPHHEKPDMRVLLRKQPCRTDKILLILACVKPAYTTNDDRLIIQTTLAAKQIYLSILSREP